MHFLMQSIFSKHRVQWLIKDSYQSTMSFLESYRDIFQPEKKTDSVEVLKSFSFDW